MKIISGGNMRNLSKQLQTRSLNTNSLLKFGFKQVDDKYIFKKVLSDNSFEAEVVFKDNNLTSRVIDLDVMEDYVIVDLNRPTGKFAAEIKKEYEAVLDEIIDSCTRNDVFKSPQSKRIMEYVENRYNSKLEFLWKKFPKDAIYRNDDNGKWFAVLMVVEKSKLNLSGDGEIEIIDLKHDDVESVRDDENILKGFHMNKKHWISIPLDDRIDDDKIFEYIDLSYGLVM